MGNAQQQSREMNKDQTNNFEKSGFGDKSSYSLNKIRHYQLKAYYASQTGQTLQEGKSKHIKAEHQIGHDDEIRHEDSHRESTCVVADEPEHQMTHDYLLLQGDANAKFQRHSTRKRYVFVENRDQPAYSNKQCRRRSKSSRSSRFRGRERISDPSRMDLIHNNMNRVDSSIQQESQFESSEQQRKSFIQSEVVNIPRLDGQTQ